MESFDSLGPVADFFGNLVELIVNLVTGNYIGAGSSAIELSSTLDGSSAATEAN